MFQFAGFAPLAGYYAFSIVGCPIRTPADRSSCAAPRGFSQLIASFFASGSLGIPHAPLLGLSPCPCALSFLPNFLLFSPRARYGRFCQYRALSQYVNELFFIDLGCEMLDLRLKKSNIQCPMSHV